ncbi:MAG: hypothetical protein HYU52_14430 [Acidobacteria bacterium]|nr:hypothetical protein [Acidobacteriota bacterium]
MKIVSILAVALLGAFSVGCATAGQGGGMPPSDTGGGAAMVKDHVKNSQVGHFDCKANKPEHKLPLSIHIDATDASRVAFPERIGLCKNKTDLVWVALGATEIAIDYKPSVVVPPQRPAKLTEAKAACYELRDADNQSVGMSCVLNKAAHKEHGWIGYDIRITTGDGTKLLIDPQLIIQK